MIPHVFKVNVVFIQPCANLDLFRITPAGAKAVPRSNTHPWEHFLLSLLPSLFLASLFDGSFGQEDFLTHE